MRTPNLRRRRSLRGGILIAALLAGGCASVPVPEAQLAVSRSAINEALATGAADSAPMELQSARNKVAQADAAVAADRNEDARRLAEEAEVDARLAAAKARTARANLAVAEIQESLRTLRENLPAGAGAEPSTPRSMP